MGRSLYHCDSYFQPRKGKYDIVYVVQTCQQLETISGFLFPTISKKMLMPLRGLRDLQFTENYFNQIIEPLLLGAQSFPLGMKVFILSKDGSQHWDLWEMEKNDALLDAGVILWGKTGKKFQMQTEPY